MAQIGSSNPRLGFMPALYHPRSKKSPAGLGLGFACSPVHYRSVSVTVLAPIHKGLGTVLSEWC